MAMELYVPAKGGSGTSYGIVGEITKTTINNVVVRIGDIVESVRDKRYGTLLGFALLKIGTENKICNLSPLVDGVGMTQAILDASLLYYNRDFTIDVPITPETIKLHSKLHSLGFEALHHGLSKDHVSQITYIKDRNLGWI